MFNFFIFIWYAWAAGVPSLLRLSMKGQSTPADVQQATTACVVGRCGRCLVRSPWLPLEDFISMLLHIYQRVNCKIILNDVHFVSLNGIYETLKMVVKPIDFKHWVQLLHLMFKWVHIWSSLDILRNNRNKNVQEMLRNCLKKCISAIESYVE